MATVARWDILKEILQTYRLGRYGLNDATQADGTTVSDKSQFGGQRGAEWAELGCEVRVHQDTTAGGGGSDLYDTAIIEKRPSDAAGTITFSFAPTVGSYEAPVVANNDTEFLVLKRDFRFEQLFFEIDQVLGEPNMHQKLIRPLTAVADGDMRDTAETDWTLSNATDDKVAATFPLGERALKVTDSGSGGGYDSTGNLSVEELKSYYLEVTGWGVDAADSGTVVLYDVTNGAAITLDSSAIDRLEPEILQNPSVQIPSGCKQVDIRLTCDAASDVLNWAMLHWRKNEELTFTLEDKPYRIEDIGQVRATREKHWGRRVFDHMTPIARDVVQLTEGLWQIQLKDSVAGMAVFYEEWVAPGTLATDDATTIAPKGDVAALVAERMLRGMDGYAKEYARAAVAAANVVARQASKRSYVNTDTRVQHTARV